MAKYTPRKELQGFSRVTNMKRQAIHLAKAGGTETLCGHTIHESWIWSEGDMITCQQCLLWLFPEERPVIDKSLGLCCDDDDYDPLGLIGDDEPDGVADALHWEIYGW